MLAPASLEAPPGRRRVVAAWRRVLLNDDPQLRLRLALLTVALVLAIGVVDFRLRVEVSLLAFYCLPVMLGVAAVGWVFGVVMAFASVASWIIGDVASGADFTRPVAWWNAGIALGTYLIVVGLFNVVRTLQREMEERVVERTATLSTVLRERERLEKAVLEITERERRLIGHDLHDGLGQHLTGTAFAAQVLGEKLQARRLREEEVDAWKIVELVEQAIEKSRRLAKGLLLAEIQQEGLIDALQELADDVTEQFRVGCTFRTAGNCELPEHGTATHVLRIAQEAVRNAIHHGRARHIEIALCGDRAGVDLTVQDDGSGIPPETARGEGLGLRIMEHRAQIVGGTFSVAPSPRGGTVVACHFRRIP